LNVKFKNKNIFHVEIISNKKIFYKTNFIKKINKKDFLFINNYRLRFLDYFNYITLRRGIHSKNGDILSEKKIFPKKIENHNIFKYLK